MIENVTGKVDYITAEYMVLKCGPVGYKIFCPNPFTYRLQEEKTVYTYHYVREDILALYGFPTRSERDLFVKLLNVSGIGPKGALAILAFGQPEQVISAIENEDERFLVKFPGVGKKTARQIILDLKGKLAGFSSGAIEIQEGLFAEEPNNEIEEAAEALAVLGYAKKEIDKILPNLKKEKLSANEYVKKALQQLMK